MNKRDARKLDSKVQQELRYLAIDLFKQGKSKTEISQTIKVSKSAVTKWITIFNQSGLKGLILKKRGVRTGTRRKLSLKQTEMLHKILIDKTPDQVEIGFSLWTRHAIQLLVHELWRINISIRTAGRYMKRLGFTPQKPIKRAYEQNPKAVKKWLNKTYPEIAKKALHENAEIHWLDETKLTTYSNYLRGYSPKGKTPTVRMKSKHMRLNVMSTVSKLGKMRFKTYKESTNTSILVEFLNRLRKDSKKKLFVILDNLAVHHSKEFKKWLKKHKSVIEVFYLPPYSPELNPDERLNRDLKTHFYSGTLAKNEIEFKKKAISHLMKIQKSPHHILNYFSSKYVKYAV